MAASVEQSTNTIDADAVDADAGAPRRLGVAADREDVAAEARALGEEVEHAARSPTRISMASGTPRSWFSTTTRDDRTADDDHAAGSTTTAGAARARARRAARRAVPDERQRERRRR